MRNIGIVLIFYISRDEKQHRHLAHIGRCHRNLLGHELCEYQGPADPRFFSGTGVLYPVRVHLPAVAGHKPQENPGAKLQGRVFAVH